MNWMNMTPFYDFCVSDLLLLCVFVHLSGLIF